MVAFSETGWNVSELTPCGLDGNTLDAKSIIDALNVWCHAVPLYGDIPIFHQLLPEQRKMWHSNCCRDYWATTNAKTVRLYCSCSVR